MEPDQRKEENWVKSVFSKVSLTQPAATMQHDTKLKDSVISLFMSTFEPLFDPEKKKEYLPCEYYRAGKSYRSPLSNKYYPKVEEIVRFPTESMQNMEKVLNDYLQGYLKHYHLNGIGTAYAFEREEMLQYHIIILNSNSTAGVDSGTEEDEPVTTKWNISHYFTITKEDKAKERYRYDLKSNCTVYIRVGRKTVSEQAVHINKKLLEKNVLKKETAEAHVKNIGRIMEKMEGIIRKEIEFVYVKKVYDMTKELNKEKEQIEENERKIREDLIREISHLRLTKQ